MSGPAGPLTVGTAGHVDHGKTALVAALTGVDTDRLAEERRRGLTIELGYAPLTLPSGRQLSLIDVPGHERLIRTMVAGASGIDCYMMVIAANEAAMPQTREHAQILRALAIEAGIVVITKTDLADPAAAIADATELLPGAAVVVCPALPAQRRAPVLAALEALARGISGRAATSAGAGVVLHIDRCFTITGAGTVVTGTLACGELRRGDTLVVYPQELELRVRGVQVHGGAVLEARAGQRVAVNLAGVPRSAIARGDVLASAGAVRVAFAIDAAADIALSAGRRVVYVHHGTRATLARVRVRVRAPGESATLARAPGESATLARVRAPGESATLARVPGESATRARVRVPGESATLARVPGESATLARGHVWGQGDGLAGGELIQLRCQTPLLTRPGDRLVLRDAGCRETLGGALVLSVASSRVSDGPAVVSDGPAVVSDGPAVVSDGPANVRDRPAGRATRAAGPGLVPARGEPGLIRLAHGHHASVETVAAAEAQVRALIAENGHLTLPGLRDRLGSSRSQAKALLDYFDTVGLTRRRADDTRILRRRR